MTDSCEKCGGGVLYGEALCRKCVGRPKKQRSNIVTGNIQPCKVCGKPGRLLRNEMLLERFPQNQTNLCMEHYYKSKGYDFQTLDTRLQEIDENERKEIALTPEKTKSITTWFEGVRERVSLAAKHLHECYYFPNGR